jgi:hypothetical protein
MNLIRFLCILLILFFSAASAWASSTWLATSIGNPYFEYQGDEGPIPAHITSSYDDREVEAQSGWWSLGGYIHSAWDSSQNGMMYAISSIEKDFTVTSAGPASITISLNGTLQVNANSAYNNQYFLYSSLLLEDDAALGNNPDVYWYDELNTSEELPVAYSTTFNYNFLESDIGHVFTTSLYFDTTLSPWTSGSAYINIADGDSLEFVSSFKNGVTIDGITGGIMSADGPALVPIPPTFWLFASAIIATFGVRRKSNQLPANTHPL